MKNESQIGVIPILIALVFFAGIFSTLLSCTGTRLDPKDKNFTIISEVAADMFGEVYTIKDKKTGKEYIVIRSGTGITITPRLLQQEDEKLLMENKNYK